MLTGTPRECCVFNLYNDHLIPFDDIVSRLGGVRYVEMDKFMALLEQAKQDPAKPGGNLQTLSNPPSVSYTMQVLYRLGFSWNQTSREYVDMIFDILRTLGYLQS